MILETLDATLRSHFHILYRRQRLLGKSERTVTLYGIALDAFDRLFGRPALVSDLSDDAIIAMMESDLANGRANRTANRNRECLVALWNFLARKGVEGVRGWPDVRRLPEPDPTPVAWTREQLSRLWAACRDAPGMIGDLPAPRFWTVLHSLLWDSADRIGPVRATRCEWIDLDSGVAVYPAASRKGRRQSHTFRLHLDTVEVIRPIWSESGELLPFPYSGTYLYRLYNRLLERAGLPRDRFHKFHAMRKSVGSWIHEAGGDACAALGHRSERVTRRHYLDQRICGSQGPAEILFRPGE